MIIPKIYLCSCNFFFILFSWLSHILLCTYITYLYLHLSIYIFCAAMSVVNGAVVHTYLHLCFLNLVFSQICSSFVPCGSCTSSIFPYKGTSVLFSVVAVTIYIPPET